MKVGLAFTTVIFLMMAVFIVLFHFYLSVSLSILLKIGVFFCGTALCIILINSFGLYSISITKNQIIKKHPIYFWKNRDINFSEIKWVEFQPIFVRNGFHLFKIYLNNGRYFHIQAREQEIYLTIFYILKNHEEPVYIRKKSHKRSTQSIHDNFIKKLIGIGLEFNDKNFEKFISEHPKYNRPIQ